MMIFRDSFMLEFEENESVEVDDSYVGEAPKYVKCPKRFTEDDKREVMKTKVRNRQERVNNQFKC